MRSEEEIRKELKGQKALVCSELVDWRLISREFHEGIIYALKWVLEEK